MSMRGDCVRVSQQMIPCGVSGATTGGGVPAAERSRTVALLGILLLVLLLSACSGSLPRRPAVMQTYDFGLIQPSAAQQSRQQSRPLVVMHPVTAPRKLSGQSMFYRLAYRDNGMLRLLPYSQSRWADAPASLFQVLLHTGLSTDYSVLSPAQKINMTEYAGESLQLRVELLACSQVFYRPEDSLQQVAAAAESTGNQRRRGRKKAAQDSTTDSAAATRSSDGADHSEAGPASEAVMQVRVVIARSTGAQARLLHNRVLTARVPAAASAAAGAQAMQQAALELTQQIQTLLVTAQAEEKE